MDFSLKFFREWIILFENIILIVFGSAHPFYNFKCIWRSPDQFLVGNLGGSSHQQLVLKGFYGQFFSFAFLCSLFLTFENVLFAASMLEAFQLARDSGRRNWTFFMD